MSENKPERGPGSRMRGPVHAPVKRQSHMIRPLSLSKSYIASRVAPRTDHLSSAPDLPVNNNPPLVPNVIVRRKYLDDQKEKIKDLEAKDRALSTSYSVQNQDIKGMEATIEEQESRIRELERQVLLAQQSTLESLDRQEALLQENGNLRQENEALRGQPGDFDVKEEANE